MLFDFHYLEEAIQLYWLSYLALFAGALVALVSQLRTQKIASNNKWAGTLFLALGPAACSLALVVVYYVLVYSNFRTWTSELSITDVLHWTNYAGTGELVVKQIGLLLLVPFAYVFFKKQSQSFVAISGKRLTLRVVPEVFSLVVIVVLLCYVVGYLMKPGRGLLVLADSGAVQSSMLLTLAVAIVSVVASEIYFRRVLLEMALQGTGQFIYLTIVLIWLASALFHTVTWPLVLWSVIIEGGAVVLYLRWRNVFVCICYDLIFVLVSILI